MKKVIIKSRIIILIVCVIFLTRSYAYAQNATTQAQVEFMAGEGPTYPVDPENPGTDVGTEPPVTGSLVIVSVSDFNFGAIQVTSAAGLYNIETDKPNIQVVDLRGTGTGWRVSASVTSFSDGENESLPGAAILINNGRPNSLSSSAAPVQAQNVRLTTDGESYPVITAAAGAGTGLWVMRWYPPAEGAYIQLEVPAGSATIGSHTATINWILENTPSE